mgnify:FL=1
MNLKIIFFTLLVGFNFTISQEIKSENITQIIDEDPLRPSKAAFYSAVIPGLGQIFNKRYWKVPLVYGAIGASIYAYDFNEKNYKRYRNAYKRRISGFQDDEFQSIISDNNRLIDGQNFYKRNRDRSMLFIVGFYFLNILDANIDAHLKQYNVNSDLSIRPFIENDTQNLFIQSGISLTLSL